MAAAMNGTPRFMDVKQVASYLHLNEKKVYALVREGRIPGTKVTGKWMFPRELVDRWMLESSHGGLLTDRLVIAGADDPLLYRIVLTLTRDAASQAFLSYTATGTQMGLELLQSRRVDLCGLHWGPCEESHLRHPALLRRFSGSRNWVLVRAFRRAQGFMMRPDLPLPHDIEALLDRPLRWSMRPEGTGANRFLRETLTRYGIDGGSLELVNTALSERDAASRVALRQADIAPGTRAAATESGLAFVTTGWECFDIAMERGIYFRKLLQELIARIRDVETAGLAAMLGGYDLTCAGTLVWGHE